MLKDQLQSRFCLIIKVHTGVPVHENEALSTTRKQIKILVSKETVVLRRGRLKQKFILSNELIKVEWPL